LVVLRAFKFLLIVCAVALLGGCSGNSGAVSSGLTQDPAALARVYRIGVGDKLKVVVFGEPELSSELEVGAGGTISMPLLGEVPVKGKTIRELTETITVELDGAYLKDPKVSVEVLNFRSFFVHGEVKGGGEYAFKNGLTVQDAVAMAGGYSYRADQTYVELRREGAAQAVAVSLGEPVPVLPGDNILVPERFF
jgi:polysaccharide export outer membrane protein